jgi:hypothetical protein
MLLQSFTMKMEAECTFKTPDLSIRRKEVIFDKTTLLTRTDYNAAGECQYRAVSWQWVHTESPLYVRMAEKYRVPAALSPGKSNN